MLSKPKFIQKCYRPLRLTYNSHTRCLSINRWRSQKSDLTEKEVENEITSPSGEAKTVKLHSNKIGVTNNPFTKNLFLGRFQKDWLNFPQIDQNDFAEVNGIVNHLEKYFDEQVDSKAIDENAKIPDKVLEVLKEIGMFGQQIPVEYGGLGLDATKYARLAEVTGRDGAISVTLAGHQTIGLKAILQAGNEAQKQKYLPKLATGELVAAFCLTEPSSGSDAASIRTKATLSEDGQLYFLNGSKIWISNGGIADLFTVFAKTEIINDKGEKEDKITAFIVEREFGGVTSGRPEDKLGIRGSNTCEVHFEDTPIPVENVIGEVGKGFKIAMNVLNSGRFSMGSSSAGALKKLLGMTTEHATSRKQFHQPIAHFGMIKEKFGKIATQIYVMESMAYLTAGFIDLYEEPDVSLEAAIVKVFSSEATWQCVNECLQIVGGMGYMKDYPYERMLRDARILSIFEGTNEILRLLISLESIKFAGREMKEMIMKLRNPLQNPKFVLTTAISKLQGRGLSDKAQLLYLGNNVHQLLWPYSEKLEKSVYLLKSTVEIVLERYGNDILHEQMILRRLSDIAIDIFAMTACLSRTTRSISLGHRNFEHEIKLTQAFCIEAYKRINQNADEIDGVNLDRTYGEVADDIYKAKGYVPEHPLSKPW
ncbi:hypothetical protein LOTGIDRAFT_182642 [Lottia gigantea]|uniref:Acyl-CoA dehydrogenase family member 9, mitochondrial n=1 Tax=Lottia gigantea TaxID=225164 RepID=V4A3Y5_LOTGI|nr:hypothetical protein LOTGIDRAFT_182642 [Lottia gigantea]ESO91377.1 hypothetical protein LOTGIDRAFT_182642 [Lottia gigantea]